MYVYIGIEDKALATSLLRKVGGNGLVPIGALRLAGVNLHIVYRDYCLSNTPTRIVVPATEVCINQLQERSFQWRGI